MRCLIFSDIHGNLLWFNALLDNSRSLGVDRFIFLGDAVSYFPDGNGVLDRLRAINVDCVQGNHDNMLRGEFPIPEKNEPIYRLRETMATISEENMAYIKTWPTLRKKTLGGKRCLFVHGHPEDPFKGYCYPDSPLAEYDSESYDIVFMGHTHRAMMRQNANTLLVNVGSIGLPREHGCAPSFALFDTDTGDVSVNYLDMDYERIMRRYPNVHPSVQACLSRA